MCSGGSRRYIVGAYLPWLTCLGISIVKYQQTVNDADGLSCKSLIPTEIVRTCPLEQTVSVATRNAIKNSHAEQRLQRLKQENYESPPSTFCDQPGMQPHAGYRRPSHGVCRGAA